jgi:Fic family protein
MVNIREFIRESNAIESVHDEAAVTKSLEAWDFLKSVDTLTHDTIKGGHELILEDRQPEIAGAYRNIQVHIGEQLPPPPVAVEGEMERLLTWTPSDPLAALHWHIAFEHIHPFADGNGRIGRLLYLWQCSEQLDSEPIIWRADDREGYYDLFAATIDISEHTEGTYHRGLTIPLNQRTNSGC